MSSVFKREANFFGIHTMIFHESDVDQHLDWAHHLVGDGGYIKQLFGPVTRFTKEPSEDFIRILNGIYKRNMIPVIRIAGVFVGDYWLKPEATGPCDYSELAQAVKAVFEKIPYKKGVPVYVEVFNEPNLLHEWGNETPDPVEYGHLLVDVSKALRSIGDPRIRIVNGSLSPGGNYNNIKFIEDMIKGVPESLWAFDYWGTHPYPADHPPEYNNHDNTSKYRDFTIDSYTLELEVLEKFGRSDVKIIITETGYELGNNMYHEEGMNAITEELRTDYITRAFRDYWSKWPEIVAVCPYELVAVEAANWQKYDWLHLDSGSDINGYPTKPRPQYDAVAALAKLPYICEDSLKDTNDKVIDL